MVDILHRIGITATPDEVYAALTTLEGLAGWWTTDTSETPDGVLAFRFGDVGGFDMQVLGLTPNSRVMWEVVQGPPEWVGTIVIFELATEGDWTIVHFAHTGWSEPVEFMSHCSTKWSSFLFSLKALVESGKGAPHPHDVQISNWH